MSACVLLAPAPVVAQDLAPVVRADTPVASTVPAAAAVIRADTPAAPVAARSGAESRGLRVTAFDIYLACQHPDVIRQAPPSREAQRVGEFCRRGLPARGGWLSASEVQAWLRTVPEPEDIRTYAVKTAELRNRAVSVLDAAQALIDGNDVSGGLIQFIPGDVRLDLASEPTFQAESEALSVKLGDGALVAAVLVRAYPDGTPNDRLAKDRADALCQRLRTDPVLAGSGVLDCRPWTSADSAQYPLQRYAGRATVHLRFRPRPVGPIASLGRVRFEEGEATLDRDDSEAIAQVAADIIAANLPADYPIVITGYADANTRGTNEGNLILARQRAEAIRNVLAVVLQEYGIAGERIVARGDVVRLTTVRPTAEQRDSARTAEISLGSLPGPSLPPPAVTPEGQAAASGMLSVEGIASAAASVMVERAEREVQAYVFRLVASEVCRSYSDLLPRTCSMLHDPTSNSHYQLSMANLQQLVRGDFGTLPSALLTRALVSRFTAEHGALRALSGARSSADTTRALAASLPSFYNTSRWNQADVRRALAQAEARAPWLAARIQSVDEAGGWALVSAYGLEFVRRVSNGDPLLETARGFGPWLTGTMDRYPMLAYLSDSRPVARVQLFTQFLNEADSAVSALRRQAPQALSADTVYLYAIRTALVNATAEIPSDTIAKYAAYVVQARRQLDRATLVVDSLRAQIRAVAGTGDEAVQRRRDLYTVAIGELTGSFYTLLMDAQLTPAIRDSIARIATPVRNLFHALQSGDMRAAFTETLALLPHAIPPMVSGRCTVSQAEGCARLGLKPQVLRLAAFASDVAQARTEDELRGSMERFLDQSSDVAIKRTGPPRTRMFVNGYVTGSLEAGGDGPAVTPSLQVPLGLEVVWRNGNGRPDWTIGGFLRLVELGGFLPSEEQGDNRSTDELLSSLIRPGLFVVLGAPEGIPATLGLGFTTSMSRVHADVQAQQEESWEWRTRVSAFLGWDIPIFP